MIPSIKLAEFLTRHRCAPELYEHRAVPRLPSHNQVATTDPTCRRSRPRPDLVLDHSSGECRRTTADTLDSMCGHDECSTMLRYRTIRLALSQVRSLVKTRD